MTCLGTNNCFLKYLIRIQVSATAKSCTEHFWSSKFYVCKIERNCHLVFSQINNIRCVGFHLAKTINILLFYIRMTSCWVECNAFFQWLEPFYIAFQDFKIPHFTWTFQILKNVEFATFNQILLWIITCHFYFTRTFLFNSFLISDVIGHTISLFNIILALIYRTP